MFGFTDSNWCRDKDDSKSTTGYIFIFGATSISWCSKKKSVVALLSCEFEYIATLLCACQAVSLMNLFKESGTSEGEVVTILVDNIYVINLAKKPIARGRKKYIEMRFHFLRKLISEGKL